MPPPISIRDARLHNLKCVSFDIPRSSLFVLTGPSGSGKSSLAVDTVVAEAEYRQAVLQAPFASPRALRPVVGAINNLPPVIPLTQRPGPTRHTIGSFLAIDQLLADELPNASRPCPQCGKAIVSCSPDAIVAEVARQFAGRLVAVSARCTPGDDRSAREAFEDIVRNGYERFIFKGVECSREDLAHAEELGSFSVVIDRFTVASSNGERLQEAVTQALVLESSGVEIQTIEGERGYRMYSPSGTCTSCGYQSAGIAARHFDFTVARENGGKLQGFDGLSLIQTRELSLLQLHEVPLSEWLDREVEFLLNRVPKAIAIARPLGCLDALGLGYLTLRRSLASLSTGELHRVQLAKQLHLPVTHVLFVIDEPARGLHAADQEKLADALRAVRNQDNTILFTEHKHCLIRAADYGITLGPGSGPKGGTITHSWNKEDYMPSSLPLPPRPPFVPTGADIVLRGASQNNLRVLDLTLPTGALIGVAGVSGSGKSSLIAKTLLPAARKLLAEKQLRGNNLTEFGLAELHLPQTIKRIVAGTEMGTIVSPYSMVATYLEFFDALRRLFAQLPLARMRGYTAKTFQLGPRPGHCCPACHGTGQQSAGHSESLTCSACAGRRYEEEICEVQFKGLSLPQLLALDCVGAERFIGSLPECRKAFALLRLFHLEYLPLGQATRSLSNGELQRLRMAYDLLSDRPGTLYAFDEPASGLNEEEVDSMVQRLRAVAAKGNSVVVIEHDLRFLAQVDYLIELGPGPGAHGGMIVAQGTVEEVVRNPRSVTGGAMVKWGEAESRVSS